MPSARSVARTPLTCPVSCLLSVDPVSVVFRCLPVVTILTMVLVRASDTCLPLSVWWANLFGLVGV